jgi:AraC family transcriptional activator of pobA
MKQLKPSIPTHNFAAQEELKAGTIRYVPIEEHNEYVRSDPHRHNYFVVLFFHKGGGNHLIDFVQYPITDRSVHLVKPGQVHMLKRAPGSNGAAIHFSKDEAVNFPSVSKLLQVVNYPLHNHDATTFDSITTMLRLLQTQLPDSNRDVATACLAMLLLKSLSNYHDTENKLNVGIRQQFSSFEHLAEQHYRDGYKPAWYAKQLSISEKKLNELCKDAAGMTVGNFLKERILLEARRLLSHSGGSIKEIGYYLGFDDPAYFARFFASNTGTTAGAFRKKHTT